MNTPTTLTTVALAATLRVTTRTIANWRQSGCPCQRGPEGQWLFELAEVRRWCAERGLTGRPGRPRRRGEPTTPAAPSRSCGGEGLVALLRALEHEVAAAVAIGARVRGLLTQAARDLGTQPPSTGLGGSERRTS